MKCTCTTFKIMLISAFIVSLLAPAFAMDTEEDGKWIAIVKEAVWLGDNILASGGIPPTLEQGNKWLQVWVKITAPGKKNQTLEVRSIKVTDKTGSSYELQAGFFMQMILPCFYLQKNQFFRSRPRIKMPLTKRGKLVSGEYGARSTMNEAPGVLAPAGKVFLKTAAQIKNGSPWLFLKIMTISTIGWNSSPARRTSSSCSACRPALKSLFCAWVQRIRSP